MPKYRVKIQRIAYSNWVETDLDANDELDAIQKAEDLARDTVFANTKQSDYNYEIVGLVPETVEEERELLQDQWDKSLKARLSSFKAHR